MYIVQNICFISHAEQKRKEKKLADSTAKLTILKEIISNYITVVGSYEINEKHKFLSISIEIRN